MRKIGFTGTQRGMTDKQKYMIETSALVHSMPIEWHHGDCVGADEDFHKIVGTFTKEPRYDRIVIHPPLVWQKRAFCDADEWREPRDYLDRNHDIVDETEFLIATPGEFEEVLRSGTWATIRYAKRTGKFTTVIFPDGTIKFIQSGIV